MVAGLVLLIIGAAVTVAAIVVAVLDKLKITHVFMRGRPSGALGGAMRGLQDMLDEDAQKAREYIVMEKEEKDKSRIPTGEKNPEPEKTKKCNHR